MSKHNAPPEKNPEATPAPVAAKGFMDPDRVAKRRAFFGSILDAAKKIDPAALMSFLQMLMGLFGGALSVRSVDGKDPGEGIDWELETYLALQPRQPAATAIDPGKLAQWVAFFKMLWALFSPKPNTTPAELGLGDRLDGIRSIGDFLKGINTDRINDIVAQLTALLKMILGFFGVPEPATVSALAADEGILVAQFWSADQITANAIDLGAIQEFIKLVLAIIALFKKTPAPAPTGE